MKHVVSVSLGSSKRDHQVEEELMGESVFIERRGTDGNLEKMKDLVSELDGKVDAFGLGGMDLYLVIGKRRYLMNDAQKVVECCKRTPIVDGSGLKNSLERFALEQLYQNQELLNESDKILLVSALDRFGMAETIHQYGNEIIYGDVIFSLGLPIPVKSMKILSLIANAALPVVRRLPFKYLYPSANEKGKLKKSIDKFKKYYYWADVICGDFHYINKYLPDKLEDKTIITNTVTEEDEQELKKLGVSYLITTTPSWNGRAFGTNVMEALLISLTEEKQELSAQDYQRMLAELNFSPTIRSLN